MRHRGVFALLLLWLGIATAQHAYWTDAHQQQWLADRKLNQQLLRVRRQNAGVERVFHEFPEAEKHEQEDEEHHRSKRAITSCPHLYTGQFCETPICNTTAEVLAQETDDLVMIEKTASVACDDKIPIYVDSHAHFIRVTVDAADETDIVGALVTEDGQTRVPALGKNPQRGSSPKTKTFDYRDVAGKYGTGTYYFYTQTKSDGDCIVTAEASTALLAYGGFTWNVHEDKVQTMVPVDRQTVQANPQSFIPMFFGFTLQNLTYTEQPRVVSFHRGDRLELAFPPLTVNSRYGCNFNSYVGPYVCFEEGNIYYLKIRGLDQTGNVWQRVYQYTCDRNEFEPEPEPTTGPPIRENDCLNGGTSVYQKSKKAYVCYCGDHYTGARCEQKICDHGAQLNENDECDCGTDYSGDFCEHIRCPTRADNFNTQERGLAFVVRAHDNDDLKKQVRDAIHSVVSHFEEAGYGQFSTYSITTFIDGEVIKHRESDDQKQFYQDVQDSEADYNTTYRCTDSVFKAINEAFGLGTIANYIKSPLFLITDALPDDSDGTWFDLRNYLSLYRSPIYTVLYDNPSSRCKINGHDRAYGRLREMAQFTHGLTYKVDAIGDIARAVEGTAQGFYGSNLLTANDLLDSCQYAPDYQLFFVDDSVVAITIAWVGESMGIQLIDTDGNKVNYDNEAKVGDLTVRNYKTLVKGHYRINIEHNGMTQACHYRVYAQSRYDPYFAASYEITADRNEVQPIYNQDVHLVGLINHMDYPDPENVQAELVIWADALTDPDRATEPDRREVLYTSNGVFRDGCTFNLYFGSWKCTKRNQMFYVNLFVTDPEGYTVMRTTTGQCATNPRKPSYTCRNGGVKQNGVCLCTAGWQGENCETARCYNGGTPDGDYCDCYPYSGGVHCELFKCFEQNADIDFERNRVAIAMNLQWSSEMLTAIIQLNQTIETVVHDLQSAHQSWAEHFSIWQFDKIPGPRLLRTDDPSELIAEFNQLVEDARDLPVGEDVCKDLAVYESLIMIMTDPQSTRNMQIIMYVRGGLKIDPRQQNRVFELIDELDAKIHIVHDVTDSCFGDQDNVPERKLIRHLATYTGGTYTTNFKGDSLLQLPLQYHAATVFEDVRPIEQCTAGVKFFFPVASEAQSITVQTLGEFKRRAIFRSPSGQVVQPEKIFGNYYDNTYVLMRGCREGWQQVGRRCLLTREDEANWDDARQACIDQGGFLVTDNNQDVENMLGHMAGGFTAWIGLNDKQKTGTWVWDQGKNPPIDIGNYKNWKGNGPDLSAGKCVLYSQQGWIVDDCSKKRPYLCQRHIYDVTYQPGSASEPHLERGLWSVDFTTYGDDAVPCGIRVDVQSAMQLYRRFATNQYEDYGDGQAYYNAAYNMQIVHLASSVGDQTQKPLLEYAHYYVNDLTSKADIVTRFDGRTGCAYEYVSDYMNATYHAYNVLYTGFDAFGYPFQRYLAMTAGKDEVYCDNGGVKQGPQCVCPPSYSGLECDQPVCLYGHLGASREDCVCDSGFVDDFCRIANCTIGSAAHTPPPITPTGKTFGLILDGSWTDNMGGFLTDFKNQFDSTFDKLAGLETDWFSNYVAVVVYDDAYTKAASKPISDTNRDSFRDKIYDEITSTKYNSVGQRRGVMRGLLSLLNWDGFAVGSPITILTDSSIEDPKRWSSLYDVLADKHAIISTVVLSDTHVPGNEQGYEDEHVVPLWNLPYITGGGFYQWDGTTKLPAFWSTQLASYYRSYGVQHTVYQACSDKIDFFQVPDAAGFAVIDVFSAETKDMSALDPDGQEVQPQPGMPVISSKTNILATIKTDKPGVWRLNITHQDRVDFCMVAIRVNRPSAPQIGFNNEVGKERGWHSDSAHYAPVYGSPNAIIAHSSGDEYLENVQVFTHDENKLVFSSKLIKRTADCTWNYVSEDLFECPGPNFAVAVEAIDGKGYQYRRIYKTHCQRFPANFEVAARDNQSQGNRNTTRVITME